MNQIVTGPNPEQAAGPLAGVRVIELAGIGPAPFGTMLLADLGADVVRIDRPQPHAGNPVDPTNDLLNRGKRSIALDLKIDRDLATARDLITEADVLIEGYRPGVAERLGLGPEELLAANPGLVYGRMTGWGQDGPLAQRAGHDITYIALAGGLDPIGPLDGPPVPPLNLVGDFGGGGMLLVMGVLAALRHAERTGEGQVVDAAIVEGTALLTVMQYAFEAQGLLRHGRQQNLLDGGAHFYRTYATSDGQYLAVGAVEPVFYAEFVKGLGEPLEGVWLESHADHTLWPQMAVRIAQIVKSRSLADWVTVYDGTDACVAPVLTMHQAPADPHNIARGSFTVVDGITQPAPAPHFSRTPLASPGLPPSPGQHSEQIRAEIAERP